MTFRIFSMLALLFLSGAATAQIDKGTMFIGGTLDMHRYANNAWANNAGEEVMTFTSRINPRAGWYLSKQWAIGAGLNLGRDVYTSISNNGTSIVHNRRNNYAFGAFGFTRYNHFLGSKFALFVDGAVGYTYGMSREKTNSLPYNSSSVNTHEVRLSIAPGIMVFPCPRFSIEATYGNLSYSHQAIKLDNALPNTKNRISIADLDLTAASLTIGCSYYFPHRKKAVAQETDLNDQ